MIFVRIKGPTISTSEKWQNSAAQQMHTELKM